MNTTNNTQEIINTIFDEAVTCGNVGAIAQLMSTGESVPLKPLVFKICSSSDVGFLEQMMLLALETRNEQIISALRNNSHVRNMDVDKLICEGKHHLVPFFLLIERKDYIINLLYNYAMTCPETYNLSSFKYDESDQVVILSTCLHLIKQVTGVKYEFFDTTLHPSGKKLIIDDVALLFLHNGKLELFKLLCEHRQFAWGTKCAMIDIFCNLQIDDDKKDELYKIIMKGYHYRKCESTNTNTKKLLSVIGGLTPFIFNELTFLSGDENKCPLSNSKTFVPSQKVTNDRLILLRDILAAGLPTMENLQELDESCEGRQILTQFGLLN